MFEVHAETLSGGTWVVGNTPDYEEAVLWVNMVHKGSNDLAAIFIGCDDQATDNLFSLFQYRADGTVEAS